MARTPAKKAAEQTPVASNKLKAFNDALAMLNKDFKTESGTLIAKLSDRPLNVETISTGSVVLDSILGGGIPKGRLIEIYGPEASGKTSMALTAAANVQKEGGTVAFIDLENALDPRYAAKLGVNTAELAVSQPDYGEQALDLVEKLASTGVVDLIILDSIASLVPKAELEGDMEQQSIGVVARLMSKALRRLVSTANKHKATVIFINQTRDAIGGFSPFGTPQTTTGGKAMKFYASQRIEVKKRGQVKDGKDTIGTEVKLKVVKNKIAPPFGEGITVLTFNKGINRAAEMIEVGPDYGVVGRPNNRTYTEAATGEIIATSKADAVAALENDPELLERLSVALNDAIGNDLFNENQNAEVSHDEEEDDEDFEEEAADDAAADETEE